MKVYAITGVTGLLGSNLFLEILKKNVKALDRIKVFAFGRDSNQDLIQRIRLFIERSGWQYFLDDYNQDIINDALSCIIPIQFDLSSDSSAQISEFEKINKFKIDCFFHIAALTDFRHREHVYKKLHNINMQGTKRILDFVNSFSHTPHLVTFVSSAYACGLNYGIIQPDFINTLDEYRNPYEKTKLESEVYFKNFCRENEIKNKIFRPSTIGGRILEKPYGHVTKCDVYLGWLYFFLRLKSKMLSTNDWNELLTKEIEIPVRVAYCERNSLNIIPADIAAKAIFAASTVENEHESFHLVSSQDLSNSILIEYAFEATKIRVVPKIDHYPEKYISQHEKIYYSLAGKIYTPYVIAKKPMIFDNRSFKEICETCGIETIDIDTKEKYHTMLQYAFDHEFDMKV